KMFYIPMAFMLVATETSLIITIKNKIVGFAAGTLAAPMWGHVFQLVFALAMAILAIILVIEAIGSAKRNREKRAAASAEGGNE
ncbi:MAG: hypothetical protein IJH73_08020, partial [Lachnospiraceae bacterium]|nr:hypothetical protein [Lachnospiraceae bacterium]